MTANVASRFMATPRRFHGKQAPCGETGAHAHGELLAGFGILSVPSFQAAGVRGRALPRKGDRR